MALHLNTPTKFEQDANHHVATKLHIERIDDVFNMEYWGYNTFQGFVDRDEPLKKTIPSHTIAEFNAQGTEGQALVAAINDVKAKYEAYVIAVNKFPGAIIVNDQTGE